jgi:hypothetical protein
MTCLLVARLHGGPWARIIAPAVTIAALGLALLAVVGLLAAPAARQSGSKL